MAAYESWRYRDRVVKARENFANSWKWAAPKNNVYKRDSIAFEDNTVLFYHYNGTQTIFDVTVAQQGLENVKDQLYDPLKQLVSGGVFEGKNFIPAGTDTGTYVNTDFKAWKLKSKSPSTTHSLRLCLQNGQYGSIKLWKEVLNASRTVFY